MATQETVKQITQGGVTRDVEDTTARQGLTAKANDNAVVKTISVNGGAAQTPVNGNVNISVEGAAGEDGITPHIGSNGNWWIGPETDPSNDTGIHAQGPAGTSITDAELEIANTVDGQGDVLGAGAGMIIKNNVDSLYASLNRLYNKLANMAFWDSTDHAAAAPTALDWSVPKVTVTLDKTSLDVNSMITDASDNEITGTTVQVDEGSTLVLKIAPKANYGLSAASATIGGVSQTLTQSGGIYTLTVEDVTSAITIVFSTTAVAPYDIDYTGLSHCGAPSGVTNPTTIRSGETKTVYLQADTGYKMPSSLPNGAVTGATASYTLDSNDGTKATIELSSANDDVVIQLSAILTPILVTGISITVGQNNGFYALATAPKRAAVLVLRTGASSDNSWGTGTENQNTTAMNNYATIPIPSGATSVSFKCSSSFKYGLTLVNSSGNAQNTVEWMNDGSTKKELALSSYPNATHVCINLKYQDERDFTNETLDSVNAELVIS